MKDGTKSTVKFAYDLDLELQLVKMLVIAVNLAKEFILLIKKCQQAPPVTLITHTRIM